MQLRDEFRKKMEEKEEEKKRAEMLFPPLSMIAREIQAFEINGLTTFPSKLFLFSFLPSNSLSFSSSF